MKIFLIFLFILTMLNQMPFHLECFHLRRFGISFDTKPYGLSRGKKLRDQIDKEIEKLETEYQSRKRLQELERIIL
jgi:hypothetical protein